MPGVTVTFIINQGPRCTCLGMSCRFLKNQCKQCKFISAVEYYWFPCFIRMVQCHKYKMVADALTKSLLHALHQTWGRDTASVYVFCVNASKQVYVQSEIV